MQAPDPTAAKSVGDLLFHPASIAAAITLVLNGLFLLVIKGRSDWYFSKKLKQFEHDLGKVTSDAEYNYKRDFLNFERYSEKRSIAYAEIFKQASLLSNALAVLDARATRIRNALSSEDKDGFLIDSMLASYGLSTPAVSALRNTYYQAKQDNEPDPAGAAVRRVNTSITTDGRSQLNAFANTVADHALYLKHPVERHAQDFYLAASHALVILLDSNAHAHVRYQEPFEELKKAMKEQLSIGDYEVPIEQRLLEDKRLEYGKLF
jgi:hypothetical protein